jgi:hypothetical protein
MNFIMSGEGSEDDEKNYLRSPDLLYEFYYVLVYILVDHNVARHLVHNDQIFPSGDIGYVYSCLWYLSSGHTIIYWNDPCFRNKARKFSFNKWILKNCFYILAYKSGLLNSFYNRIQMLMVRTMIKRLCMRTPSHVNLNMEVTASGLWSIRK